MRTGRPMVHGFVVRGKDGVWGRHLRSQHGQVVVWVMVMLPLMLSMIGLAADGGLVFAQREQLQNLADGAARMGAEQLDTRAYYGNGGTVTLDPVAAQRAALDYLGEQAPGIVADVAADQTTVVIRVERDVPLAFLRIIRINVTHIRATATAEMRHGVASGGR